MDEHSGHRIRVAPLTTGAKRLQDRIGTRALLKPLLPARYLGHPQPMRASRHERVVRQIRDYLHEHVEQTVTICELTAIASLSRFPLTRVFQSQRDLVQDSRC
jgi:transcriptional regulator GlxA family with amidase domain